MAIENTLLGAEQQLQSVTDQEQNLVDQPVSSNKLDTSTSENPLGDLAGLNLDEVTDQSPTTLQTTEKTTDPPTLNDLSNLANKRLDVLKNWSGNVAAQANTRRDPRLAYGDYEFDQYTTNVDRYRGYGKETFNKLGFNPLDDNENYYNANTSNWQDFKRMTGQYGTFFNSAFTSNYRSMGSFFSEGKDLISPDEEGAADFEAMKIGMSSKKGWRAWTTNFVLNSAYTAGIIANVYIEDLVLAGIEYGTGALATPLVEARVAQNMTRLATAFEKVKKFNQIYKSMHQSTMVGGMLKGGFQMVKSFKNINNAREFYTGIRLGAETFGRGLINFANPLRQTTEVAQNIAQGSLAYKNMSNFAKLSRGFGGFYRDMRENWFAFSESQLEGGSTEREVFDEQMRIYKEKHNGKVAEGKDLQDIYKNAQDAGRLVTAINIPLIYTSNRFVFDGIFNFRGAKGLIEAAEGNATKGVAKNFTWNLAEKSFKENVKGFLKADLKQAFKPKVLAGSFLKYTQANFAEGFQESAQELTSGAVKNYYRNVYKDPSLGGRDYIKSSVYSSLGENVFSSKGLDVFLSGFLMGGATHSAGKLLFKTLTGSQNLFLQSRLAPKTWKERYENYQKQKEGVKEIVRNSMNTVISDPEKFFGRKEENISNQKRTNQDMTSADLNNDDLSFYDAKDDKTLDHVFTVIESGGVSQLKAALNDLKSLSDDELMQAYNTTDGPKARQKLDEYITRIDQIQKSYDFYNNKFGNPFNPSKFTKKKVSKELSDATQYLNNKITAEEFLSKIGVDVENLQDDEIVQVAEKESGKILNEQSEVADYVKEFIAYKAFEDAKKAAIASSYGYERSVERMVSLFQDIVSTGPLSRINASDFTVLQSEKGIKDEIKLLKEEISNLELGDKDQKSLAKKKSSKLENLQSYLEVLKEHKASKGNPIVNEKGQVEIVFNESTLDPLRKAYEKYLKSVAKLNDDYIFDSKVEDSFNKLLDYYDLDASSRRYNNAVNTLSNPESLYRYADIVNSTLTDLYLDRFNIMEKRVSDYMSIFEFEMLTKVLGEMGVKIDNADVENLITKGIIPTTYLDLRRNTLITSSDARHSQIIEMVKNFASLQENKTADEAEAAQEEKPVEEVTEEEQIKEEPKKEETVTKLPVDLEIKLKKAFNEYIRFNPDANITFEEYINTSSKAQSIKEQYNEEQKKPTAPVTKEEEKVTTETPKAEEKKEEAPIATVSDVEAKKTNIEEVKNIGGNPFNGFTLTNDKFATYQVNNKNEVEIVKNKSALAAINSSLPTLYNWAEFPNTTESTITVIKKPIVSFDKNGEVIVKQKGEIIFDAELSALEGTKPTVPTVEPVVEETEEVREPIIEEPIGRDKVKKILSGIKSLRDMPNLALNDKSDVTRVLTEMSGNLEIDAIELNQMIDARREELKKLLTPSDIKKGDFITFNDRRKGWVTSTTRAGTFQMKMVGSEKGAYDIIKIDDIIKNVSMIEKDKKVSTEPIEAPTVTQEDRNEIEASKTDTRQEFSSNIAKVQESTNQAKENSKDGVNNNLTDLLNNLGCKTKGK